MAKYLTLLYMNPYLAILKLMLYTRIKNVQPALKPLYMKLQVLIKLLPFPLGLIEFLSKPGVLVELMAAGSTLEERVGMLAQ